MSSVGCYTIHSSHRQYLFSNAIFSIFNWTTHVKSNRKYTHHYCSLLSGSPSNRNQIKIALSHSLNTQLDKQAEKSRSAPKSNIYQQHGILYFVFFLFHSDSLETKHNKTNPWWKKFSHEFDTAKIGVPFFLVCCTQHLFVLFLFLLCLCLSLILMWFRVCVCV